MKRPNAPLQSVLLHVLCEMLEQRRQPATAAETGVYRFFGTKLCAPPLVGRPVKKALPPPPLTPETSFVELTLGFEEPLVICDQLCEKLELPPIPRRLRRRLPSTFDFQDSLPQFNPYAECWMTLGDFTGKLASWLRRCHPAVVRRIAPLTFA